jgi:hypothetical protein
LFQKDETFEFPNIFGKDEPPEAKQIKSMKESSKKYQAEASKSWAKADLPGWFR